MVNDESEYPSQSEEEYHFGEPESPSDYSEAAAAVKEKSSRRSSWNKLWMLLVVAALLFTLYKLFDVLVLSRAKRVQPITPVVTIPVKPQVPIVSPPPPAVSQPTIPSAVTDRIQSLEQQTTANQAAIDKLTTQVSDLQNALGNLTTQVTNIGDGVLAINSKLAAIEEAAAQKEERRRLLVRRRARPVPVYFVKAMVQGRAWLRTEGGGTITVKVGDNVPGYGVVRIIDTNQGILTLSSGAIIGYSPDDS